MSFPTTDLLDRKDSRVCRLHCESGDVRNIQWENPGSTGLRTNQPSNKGRQKQRNIRLRVIWTECERCIGNDVGDVTRESEQISSCY